VPDLVIEILSSSTETRDSDIKLEQSLRFGVREYWLFDPQERTLEVLKAGNPEIATVRVYSEGTTATSPILEGIQMEVDRLFE